jgi:hypothetical protein
MRSDPKSFCEPTNQKAEPRMEMEEDWGYFSAQEEESVDELLNY